MSRTLDFKTIGNRVDNIDVRLSYRIVELFSEGLYASPNKAIEELVANSFDAGALNVAVLLPSDFHAQGATIAVLDDGEGMDANGLRQHWLMGHSNKRTLLKLPRGRQQIGKFGIGKLATYVLATHLTHITKKGGKFYSTSMDYGRIEQRTEGELEPKTPIKIGLRELTEEEVKMALAPWRDTVALKNCGFKLYGKGSANSWTFAILSTLKDKVHEIRRGVLEWVLRTALPLRDDFAIYLDGKKLESSKAGKGRIKKWIIGKEIKKLSKPSPDEIEAREDKTQPANSETRFGLDHKDLGRITGYAEAYEDMLTGNGKSDEWGRSHGFYVYVLGRLINVSDGHFGIKPDELRHGTFGRMRVVIHMDGLDPYLQSDRERIREGPVLADAQNILRAIFNFVRPFIDKHDEDEAPGVKLARKLAGSPASLARRPIIEMARAALDGKVKSRYIALPSATTKAEQDSILASLEQRAEKPELFVEGIDFVYDATSDEGIAVYDVGTGRLKINGLHPFIGSFFDEFTSKTSGLPLEMFSMAEVLLESHLYQAGMKQDQIDATMTARDQLLRYLARESGRRTALTCANALRNARNDETKLEIEVVEAFRNLGFEATRKGAKGEPDGVAWAHLGPNQAGMPRKYSLTLEAKSKRGDGKKVAAATVDTATIARHRDDYRCDHALVVGPAFPTAQGDDCALAKQIDKDRRPEAGTGKVRTITLINVDDLARLVQLRPVKRLDLARIREMLTDCRLPEECKRWIDRIEKETVAKPPYGKIINAIHDLQKEYAQAAVEYGALRVALGKETPPYKVNTNEDLIELCKAMAAMASYEISATDRTVELNQSPANVLAAIESATKSHLA